MSCLSVVIGRERVKGLDYKVIGACRSRLISRVGCGVGLLETCLAAVWLLDVSPLWIDLGFGKRGCGVGLLGVFVNMGWLGGG